MVQARIPCYLLRFLGSRLYLIQPGLSLPLYFFGMVQLPDSPLVCGQVRAHPLGQF